MNYKKMKNKEEQTPEQMLREQKINELTQRLAHHLLKVLSTFLIIPGILYLISWLMQSLMSTNPITFWQLIVFTITVRTILSLTNGDNK